MVWGCFSASVPGHLVIIEGTINSKVYENIFQQNVRAAVHDLKEKTHWVMQEDCVLEWPSHSPNLNPMELLWPDLKRALQEL